MSTMISLREFLIQESKQVGTLYHFTRLSSLEDIFINYELVSHQDYISFTRNPDMINYEKYKNFSNDLKLGESSHIVRISIDGDKLSNEYKIEPFIDNKNGIKRHQGEYEERIIKQGIKKGLNDRINFKKAFIQVDILDKEKNLQDFIKQFNFKINLVDKFKKVNT